ncbi:MAG: cobalamin B12-binding domain-containing protein [Oceanicaulis sp.]
MAGAALERFGLAGLARAAQQSLDLRSWGSGGGKIDFDTTGPSREVLDKLIEAEIIPRLMLTSRQSADLEPAAEPDTNAPALDPAAIDAFARRAITHDPDTLVSEVNALMAAGVSHEDVLLKLLAPAARRLGRLWDEDLVDFADVTIGLMKLHRVLERLNADTPSGMGAGGVAPRVLLAPAPGEQHVFGVVMVGEFFARSGWRVRCESSSENDALLPSLAADHFDVLGLSASSDLSLKALKGVVRKAREASRNPDLFVMVGGQAFNKDLGLARRIGADATATDGVRAVVTAERMVHRLARAEGALTQ